MSIALSLLGCLFSETLLLLLDILEDMLSTAKSYLQINFIGVLFLFGYTDVSTVFR